MNYLMMLLFFIIACVLGICISLYLELKSYILSACICALIFVCIELYYNYRLNNAGEFNKLYLENKGLGVNNTENITQNITSQTLSQNDIKIASQLLTEFQQHKTDPTNTQYIQSIKDLSSLRDFNASNASNESNLFSSSKLLAEQINATHGIVSQLGGVFNSASASYPLNPPYTKTHIQTQLQDTPQWQKVLQDQKNPLDGLDPTELTNRLNYIYHATANPLEVISYNDYKTHADNILDEDKTSLLSNINLSNKENNKENNKEHNKYINNYYPQLTANNIDATDCLNDMNNKNSCFQNQYLFNMFNMSNMSNTGLTGNPSMPSIPSILNKGITQDNANLIIKEDFSLPILFRNAPYGNLDKDLNLQSNEYIDLTADSNSICRGCKLATCKNNMCALQNNLFM